MTFNRRQWIGHAWTACAAGVAPAWLRHARAADVPRFALGLASGQPRPDGMVLWTRLSSADASLESGRDSPADLPPQVEVTWEVARDERFTQVVQRGVEIAEAAWAHSVHVETSGLQAGREYWYRFRALGDQSRTGRTRTAPAAQAEATLRFAIASCQRWDCGCRAPREGRAGHHLAGLPRPLRALQK
jgi:alkaline phosphatase D